MSLYFGSRAKTSNEAELLALERMGKWIKSSTTIAAGFPWILIGDSEIAINFLGHYKPNKTLFTSIVRGIKQMAIRMKWPYGYKHVPRTQNEFADWLAQVAYETHCDLALAELFHNAREDMVLPEPELVAAFTARTALFWVDGVCYKIDRRDMLLME